METAHLLHHEAALLIGRGPRVEAHAVGIAGHALRVVHGKIVPQGRDAPGQVGLPAPGRSEGAGDARLPRGVPQPAQALPHGTVQIVPRHASLVQIHVRAAAAQGEDQGAQSQGDQVEVHDDDPFAPAEAPLLQAAEHFHVHILAVHQAPAHALFVGGVDLRDIPGPGLVRAFRQGIGEIPEGLRGERGLFQVPDQAAHLQHEALHVRGGGVVAQVLFAVLQRGGHRHGLAPLIQGDLLFPAPAQGLEHPIPQAGGRQHFQIEGALEPQRAQEKALRLEGGGFRHDHQALSAPVQDLLCPFEGPRS